MKNESPLVVPADEAARILEADTRGTLGRHARMDKGGVYNYLVVRIGDSCIAIDDDYFKIDFKPVWPVSKMKPHRSGMGYFTGIPRSKVIGGRQYVERISYGIVPVHLSEVLGVKEEAHIQDSYCIFIKRSESNMPNKIIVDGKPTESMLGLGLIVSELPGFYKFLKPPQHFRYYSGGLYPGVLKQEDMQNRERTITPQHRGFECFPTLELETALERFGKEFKERYPDLSRFYPYSPDFNIPTLDEFSKEKF